MNTYTHFLSHLAQFFLECEMFPTTNFRENQNLSFRAQ